MRKTGLIKTLSLGLGSVLLCLLLLFTGLLLRPQAEPPGPVWSGDALVLDNVHIVDTRSGKIQPDRAIWLKQGRIEQITAAGVAVPAAYHYVSGQGRYVVPGLWDNHSHSLKLSPQLHPPLYLAHGVTYLRDMSGCMTGTDSLTACAADRRAWTQQARSGQRSSPLYPQQSSFAINGGAEVPAGAPTFLRLQAAADATALVRHYQAFGVDTLKIYELLGPEQYQWLSDAAAGTGLQLAGHKPWRVTLADLIQARQRSVEHGRLFLFECSTVAMQLKQQPMREGLINSDVWRDILQSQNPQLCRQKMAAMAKARVWWSPTLLTLQHTQAGLTPLQALQTFSMEQAGSLTINLQLAWSALRSSQFRQQFAD